MNIESLSNQNRTSVERFLEIISGNRAGERTGVYAVCSAHPMVLKAALNQGQLDGSIVLVESTANQVNQFGGYTGMLPKDFIALLNDIAFDVGFDPSNLMFGGDHLGPVCWCDEGSEAAMLKAADLVIAYVEAGFKKIHLDTSMPCADDSEQLTDELVASRAAWLCEKAEATALSKFGKSDLVYVIGTEVPPPGGASDAIEGLQVTPAQDAKNTLEIHRQTFIDKGLEDAWTRVVALVVQPGVEFDHTSVHDYKAEDAIELSELINNVPNVVYEAHSSDYQRKSAYPKLVEGHFAILKVGPQLTFALREALFALSHIEDELISADMTSNLRAVCEKVMLDEPKNWHKYYPASEPEGKLYRRYSFSDRIRYYWPVVEIESAVQKLLNNLNAVDMPLPLLNQYMPRQYAAIREGKLTPDPESLIQHHIMLVTASYASACGNS